MSDRRLFDAYDVRSLPAAVLVRDGFVIWRGPAALLTQRALDVAAPER